MPGLVDELSMFARYAVGLRQFLRRPFSRAQARLAMQGQLARRGETFLQILRAGVYGNPRSPYRRLLEHAGAEFGDVARVVQADGVEAALGTLYDAGVRISIDEFKGRRPIERPGLSIAAKASDFDNPLLARHYETRTGGSRGVRTRVVIDLDATAHEAGYYDVFFEMFGLEDRRVAMWREVPPDASGLRGVLRYAKLGRPPARWFSQHDPRSPDLKFRLFTRFTVHGSRWWAVPIPTPEHVPMPEGYQIARWIAATKHGGMPVLVDTQPGSAVRLCLAAAQEGLDISGTFFRLGSEPFTRAKQRVLRDAGCDARTTYATTETGVIAMPCGAGIESDDAHVMSDAFGVIQRRIALDAATEVGALLYTSLFPACPKLLLNVEMGDHAVFDERRCGCLWDQLGFTRHLREIRSYEKLTAAGATFLGTQLVRLVEETLPSRFGGAPTDYQFVEEEQADGLTRVGVIISPRVGPVSEADVVEAVFRYFQDHPATQLMAGTWRDAGTLRVERREPYITSASKILPLHLRKA